MSWLPSRAQMDNYNHNDSVDISGMLGGAYVKWRGTTCQNQESVCGHGLRPRLNAGSCLWRAAPMQSSSLTCGAMRVLTLPSLPRQNKFARANFRRRNIANKRILYTNWICNWNSPLKWSHNFCLAIFEFPPNFPEKVAILFAIRCLLGSPLRG